MSVIVVGGQSGSPIYNEFGKVVGVVFASVGTYGGLGIPSEAVMDFMNENL